MRSPGLVVMAMAALAVVGYAFYMLTSAEPPRPERATAGATEQAKPSSRERPNARPASRGEASPNPAARDRNAASPSTPASAPAPTASAKGGPPPRPEPEMSLEEARDGFSDFMQELDQLEMQGAELTSPQWVDYYKRGHDAIAPLQQHLDWNVPEEAAELRKANEDLRMKLRTLEPRAPTP